MSTPSNSAESFWEQLLSRDTNQIRKAFSTLDQNAQSRVIAHLHKMVSEAGWQPEQRASAQAALKALGD